MYLFCCMIDHILVCYCCIPVPFQSLLSILFLKIRDTMLLKKIDNKNSVGHSASYQLSSFCNLVSIKKGQLYCAVLCGLTLLKIELPAVC